MNLERYQGCLLGQAVGDAMGAPWEGLTADHLFWSFGDVDALLAQSLEAPLRYTDDTQMMLGVAETLVEFGEIRPVELGQAFARNYDPERGYGPGGRRILEGILAGKDPDQLAAAVFVGGSLGNGAAMRVAPVGLFFAADLGRAMEQARLSAWPTHRHPIGIEGAQLLALAVAYLSRQSTFQRREFFAFLLDHASSEEFRWALRAASRLKKQDAIHFLGSSMRADRSVVTAMACFALSPDDFAGAIGRAIRLGDDTDTLAAMAGAMSGAYRGLEAVPAEWLALLEDGARGRAYLLELAGRLFRRWECA